MAEIGWVRLHRKIRECSIWDNETPFDMRSAWMDLVMMVNYEDKKTVFNYKSITIKAGQRITSVRKLADRWHWSKNRTLKFLELLEAEGMIIKESNNKRTLLTIVNYEKYQCQWDTDKDADMDTDVDTDKDADMPQINNKKNNKESKKVRKNIYGEYAHVRLTDQEKEKLINDYGQQMVDDAIRFLDEYIEMKGYKAKSHYLCIKKWVVKAVQDEKRSVGNNLQDAYEMMRKWAEEGS